MRNCVPIGERPLASAWLCGTDASDWGTGQLLWKDGQRGEVTLAFGPAEKRRPINWRELLGILRTVEEFGNECSGLTLLVETDSTAAMGAAQKGASTAEDSQELLRRLLEVCERWNITLRMVHTPGLMLHRPDQISRGDPVEEPRVRLCERSFNTISKIYGPFSEACGPERRYMGKVPQEAKGVTKIWMHSTHTTVGSALRLLGERLAEADGEFVTGVVMVPHDEAARWWQLQKYFRVVGRWDSGSTHLQMNQLGSWVQVVSKRPTLLLAFPRMAGGGVAPVYMGSVPGELNGLAKAEHQDGDHWYRMLLRGSMVYRRGSSGQRGELFFVWADFDAAAMDQKLLPTGEPVVQGAELLLQTRRKKSPKGAKEYRLDRRGPPSGSFSGGKATPWSVPGSELWVVDCLVEMKGESRYLSKPPGGRSGAADLERLVFLFDYEQAEAEMERRLQSMQRWNEPVVTAPESREATNAQKLGAAQLIEMQAEADALGLGVSAETALVQGRKAAAEAATLRTRPQSAVCLRPKNVQQPAPVRQQWHLNRYTDSICISCERRIPWGARMVSAGWGFACSSGCEQAYALNDNQVRMSEMRARVAERVSGAESLKRATLFAHRLSDDRLDLVLTCMEGRCTGASEARSLCIRGCGRGVHMVQCCMLSTGFKALGKVICAVCRAEAMVGIGCASEVNVMKQCVKAMLVEMSSGADSTAVGYAEFVRLEREWAITVVGQDCDPHKVRLPHTNAESFYNFVIWLATDAGRARSLVSLMRSAGAYMTKLEYTDWTKTARIKALVKELGLKSGVEKEPATQVSRLILRRMVAVTIKQACSQRLSSLSEGAKRMEIYFVAVALFTMCLEVVGGTRIGETTGARHGLLANDVCIQRKLEGEGSELGETVECHLEDSKTFSRYVVFAGKTRGDAQLECADYLRRLWAAGAVEVQRSVEGGFEVYRPDYWVVQVSLLDMPKDIYKEFVWSLPYACEAVAEQAPASVKYAKSKRAAQSVGEHERFVNIAGGTRFGLEVQSALAWMVSKGWQRFANVAKGPLIRASNGYSLTHMPLSTAAADAHLVGAMRAAHKQLTEEGCIDPELSAMKDRGVKLVQHSFRRKADEVAMNTRHLSLATDDDINFMFGWRLRELNEDMQKWYAGLNRVSRLVRLTRVTLWL